MDLRWLQATFALLLMTPAIADADHEDDEDYEEDDEDERPARIKLDPRPIGQLVEAVAARKADAVSALLLEGMEQDVPFTDRACAQTFSSPSVVGKDQLLTFARCLTTLDLKQGATPQLVTFGPGIELEARAANEKVFFLGSFQRGAVVMSSKTLESLRSGGSSNVDDLVAKKLEFIVKRRNMPVSTWMRVCIGPDGALTDVRAEDALANIGGPFSDAIRETWKFRPFELAGAKRAACAFTHVAFPAGTKAHVGPRPQKLVAMPPALLPPINVAPTDLEDNRISGEKNIVPDDKTKRAIKKAKVERVVGAWKLCLDTSGAITEVKLIKSTGYPDYDKKIEKGIAAWKYKPYEMRGRAVKVCTAVTFIYSQK